MDKRSTWESLHRERFSISIPSPKGRIELSVRKPLTKGDVKEILKHKIEWVSFGYGDWNDISWLEEIAQDVSGAAVNCRGLFNLPQIMNWPKLAYLRLNDFYWNGPVPPLSSMAQIRELRVNWQTLYGEEFFRDCALNSLRVSFWPFADLTGFSSMKALESLHLEGGKFKSVSVLGALPNLRALSVTAYRAFGEGLDTTSLTRLRILRILNSRAFFEKSWPAIQMSSPPELYLGLGGKAWEAGELINLRSTKKLVVRGNLNNVPIQELLKSECLTHIAIAGFKTPVLDLAAFDEFIRETGFVGAIQYSRKGGQTLDAVRGRRYLSRFPWVRRDDEERSLSWDDLEKLTG